MTREEALFRYERARKESDRLFQGVMFGRDSASDYQDALEITMLWKLATEGHLFTAATVAKMMEATKP